MRPHSMPSCKRGRLKHEGQPQKAARSRSLHRVRRFGLVCPHRPQQLPRPQGQGTKHAAQKPLSQGRLNTDSVKPALVHRLPPQGCCLGLFWTTRRSTAPPSPFSPFWPDPSPATPGFALHRTTCIAAPQPSGPVQLLTPACSSHLSSNPSRQPRARPPNPPTHPAVSTQAPVRPLTEQQQEHRSAAVVWPSRASMRMCRGGRGRELTLRVRSAGPGAAPHTGKKKAGIINMNCLACPNFSSTSCLFVCFLCTHSTYKTWCVAFSLNILTNCSKLKAMAPHSSTLVWKIPWTEEPGRLQSMGSLGVGHDCITFK